MLKIRLQRSGRKKRANYRIVVAEHSDPIQGRYVDLVGTYDPLVEKHGLVFEEAKIKEWIKKGAQPTNTVARLLKGKGMEGVDGFIVLQPDKKVKNPKEEPEAPAPQAASQDAPADAMKEEAPAAEEKAEEPAPEEEKKPEESKEEAPAPSENKEEASAPQAEEADAAPESEGDKAA